MKRETGKAFRWMIGVLNELEIPFQLQGGFAARAYGSKRKLEDIDIAVSDKNIGKIADAEKRYIIYGPKRYIDENSDVLLITLKYAGQELEFSGLESSKIFDSRTKKWVKVESGIKRSTMKIIYGLEVPLMPKKELIRWKRILGRPHDIEDVRQLSGTRKD